MAGGSLLDLGSYPTALATWTPGPAQDVYATGEMTCEANGQAAMVLTHGGGARSVLHTTLLTRTPTAAVIAGTAATLTLPGPFFMPRRRGRYLRRRQPDGDLGRARAHRPRRPVLPAVEVALRVTAGESESPLRPASTSSPAAGAGRGQPPARRALRRGPLSRKESRRSVRYRHMTGAMQARVPCVAGHSAVDEEGWRVMLRARVRGAELLRGGAARTGSSDASTEAAIDMTFVRPNAAMRFRLLTGG